MWFNVYDASFDTCINVQLWVRSNKYEVFLSLLLKVKFSG